MPYLVIAGIMAAILTGLIVWVKLRERRIMAAREKKRLADWLYPAPPTWTWIVGMVLGIGIIACLVTALFAEQDHRVHTPKSVTAIVDIPTVVSENGQRIVQLRFDGYTDKLTYVCAPEECKDLSAGDKVSYISYIDPTTERRVRQDLHKI